MSQSDLQTTAIRVFSRLQQLEIPFHVTGGLASVYYGEPRLTQDIDIVVSMEMNSVQGIVTMFQDNFIIEKTAVEDAVGRSSIFQALDRETFIKVDFHVGESIKGELSRSVYKPLFENFEVPLVSKEDAIVSKLLWIKKGSHKSRNDVIGMLLDPEPFNIHQVKEMASAYGCATLLKELEEEAQKH